MNVPSIQVQRLFVLVFALKIGSSFLGWWLNSPWILGFALPLLFMGTYIVLGLSRRDQDVSDEKFADTCYYLGFIFTVTSIIFSLFDLPQIGTRIQDIAVRFGAAMVSTVLGLAVRVYLVSFKKDVADAVQDAEGAILDATRRFTEQLTVVLERLRDFESQVDTAARASVERVNLQVENLSRNHADQLTSFFGKLTVSNQQSFMAALAEVKTATQRLTEGVDVYSMGMRANLSSVDAKVAAFLDAVTQRLTTTKFPDDYFVEQLDAPLEQLRESSSALAAGIKDSLRDVTQATTSLSNVFKKLQSKADASEQSLGVVQTLTEQQQTLLNVGEDQIRAIATVNEALTKVDRALNTTIAALGANQSLTSELSTRIGAVVADGVETRKALETFLANITDTLRQHVHATTSVVSSLEAGTAASREAAGRLIEKLEASAVAAQSATAELSYAANATTGAMKRLHAATSADIGAEQAVSALSQHAEGLHTRSALATGQLQSQVRQPLGVAGAPRDLAPMGAAAVDIDKHSNAQFPTSAPPSAAPLVTATASEPEATATVRTGQERMPHPATAQVGTSAPTAPWRVPSVASASYNAPPLASQVGDHQSKRDGIGSTHAHSSALDAAELHAPVAKQDGGTVEQVIEKATTGGSQQTSAT